MQLAEVLANDARSADAGATFREAAQSAPPERVLDLRHRAAEQLLRSGRTEEGETELRAVMEALGLFYPRDTARAVGALMLERTKIRARGTDFEERSGQGIAPEALLRVDATFTASVGLQQVDVMIGQYFQAKHLLLALECGEPHRIARALGIEAMYSATGGFDNAVETDALIDQVLGLARRLADPRAEGLAWVVKGTSYVYQGRFVEAQAYLQRAERLLSTRCVNVAWELSMARTFLCTAKHHAGDYAGLAESVETALEDARQRDDHHTSLMIGVAFASIPDMAAGRAGPARELIESYRRRWSAQLDSNTYRYVALLCDTRIERYDGTPERAWEIYDERWPALRRSLMLTRQPFRTFLLQERGCTALAAAARAEGRAKKKLLKVADRDISKLHGEGTPWSKAMALSLEPSLHAARGDRGKAAEVAVVAERALLERGMPVHAAAIRMRRGELAGGPDGARLFEEGMAQMRMQGIEAAARIADVLVPPVR